MEILGTVEDVAVVGEGLVLEARMDTGATSSSINALEQETFERDDEEWIRFEVVDPADEDARITLERPIERTARIRRHSGDPDERHVVRLDLCMGGQRIEAETTLVDRTQLTYQLLVGRSHMAGHVLVDSGNEHLRAPDCPEDAEPGHNAE
nr:ATP-dependent zinc protease [Thioalkalivibrio sp. ALJ24]